MAKRLLKYCNPDLSDAQNDLMYSVARWQLRGGPLKLANLADDVVEQYKVLIMDGWIIQADNDDLLITDYDLHRFGVWQGDKDCGCGSSSG